MAVSCCLAPTRLAPAVLRALTALIFLAGLSGGAAEAPPGAAARSLTPQPVPAWVEQLAWELPPGPGPDRVPAQAILIDAQDRLTPEACEYYFRNVLRLLTTEGVRQNAERQIEFTPEYQTVALHALTVTRNGEVLDRLPSARFRELQRERDLETQILNGRVTLATVLDDIRVGDVLDIAYTIRDTNPLMRGQMSARHYLGSSYPVLRERVVVRTPEQRNAKVSFFVPAGTKDLPRSLFLHFSLTSALETEVVGTERIHRWNATDIPAIAFDDMIPAAAYPYYPMLQVASFRTWSDVIEWAAPLFAPEGDLPEVLRRLLEEWKRLPDVEQRLGAAVAWVQNDLRYFSLALGPHNLKPRPVAEICRTRFGDCKDKSVVLMRLFRELAVEAYPALVSTYWRGTAREVAPSPFVFNHAIVAYRLRGETRWIDPTLRDQRGTAGRWALPPYEAALVLRPEDTSLTNITLPQSPEPDTVTRERIAIDASTGDGIVDLEVRMHELQADLYRQQLQAVSPQELSKHWFNFIGHFYKQAEEIDPPSVHDDGSANALTVRSRYRIPHLVRTEGDRKQAVVHAYALRALLDPPRSKRRHWPYALGFGRHIRHRIEVDLPASFPPEQHPQAVRSDGLEYRVEKGLVGSRFVTEHDLRILHESVPAENMPRFCEAVDEVLNALTTSLTLSPAAAPADPATPASPGR